MGDTVLVASGDYTIGSGGLQVMQPVTLRGIDGQSRPVIHSTDSEGPVVELMTPGSTLRHLTIRQDNAVGKLALDATAGGTLADLALSSTVMNGIGVTLDNGATLANSTALATGQAGTAVSATGASELLNVTAWASGTNGVGVSSSTLLLTGNNTIARAPATGGTDVVAEVSAIAALGTSNWSTESGVVNGIKQPAMPSLADPANGDFHQLRGSPTINTGALPISGLTDPDGDSRLTGGAPDIGADEFVPQAPAVITGDPVEISTSGGKLTGTVDPNGLPTNYHFDYGATPLYGNSTPTDSAGAGDSPVPVTASLGDLPAGSIVHYRLVAESADGLTHGLDRILIVLPAVDGGGGVTLPGTGVTVPAGPNVILPGAPGVPQFTTLTVPVSVPAGQPVTLTAAGRDTNDPVSSIRVDFGEGDNYFIESACRQKPRSRFFDDNRLSSFDVSHAFTQPGVYTVGVTLGSGGCGRPGETTKTTVQINVTAPKAGAKAKRDAGVIAAADCKNADLQPTKKAAKLVARAIVCVVNQQRRANGLKSLRSNKKLAKAAKLHNTYMKRGKFFAHQGPGEPSLAKRIQKYKYRGGAGENLGAGSGTSATARGLVLQWMNSPVHRANVLEKAFFTVGVDVMPQKPLDPVLPGATFTAEFGTLKK